jgi:hypothetical protein
MSLAIKDQFEAELFGALVKTGREFTLIHEGDKDLGKLIYKQDSYWFIIDDQNYFMIDERKVWEYDFDIPVEIDGHLTDIPNEVYISNG